MDLIMNANHFQITFVIFTMFHIEDVIVIIFYKN